MKDFPNIYVKKAWSTNPTEYKYIPLSKAIEGYTEYILACERSTIGKKPYPFKSFKVWLATEM